MLRLCGAALLCTAFLTILGCAHVSVTPITTGHVGDATQDGVVFYEPEPYLLVSAAASAAGAPGGAAPGAGAATPAPPQAQVIWLPNRAKAWLVQTHPGWGTVNGNVTLTNGWMLSTLGAQLDSKGPETITAITGLIKEAAAVAAAADTEGKLTPGLYRIEFKDGYVSHIRRVDLTPLPPT